VGVGIKGVAAFIFRCPDTGMNVQGWVAEDPDDVTDSYESISCLICKRAHLVNPKTGKVLGADDE